MACTITELGSGPYKLIKFEWTSDGSGDATGASSAYNGKIELVTTVPGSGGSQPTDQYDITLTDANSIDHLQGNGADRSNASTENIASASLGAVVESALTLTVANAGDTKSGEVYVYIR